ncbi:MAG: hypothetical protein PF440_05020 [Thiomicrorhabdus sp.]|jgi:hypothetical protein|nr:hypothetical protein [Thiomicrorhabdus sp.]
MSKTYEQIEEDRKHFRDLWHREVAENQKLQAEVDKLRFERDEALRLLGEKMKENEEIIDIHNEQAVCAEKFATTMAENVLFRDALKSVASRRNYCLEDDEHGETWFRYDPLDDPLDGTFAPYLVAEKALNSTPRTAKIQAILEAAIKQEQYFSENGDSTVFQILCGKTNTAVREHDGVE